MAYIHCFYLYIKFILPRYLLGIVCEDILLQAELIILFLFRFLFGSLLDGFLICSKIRSNKTASLFHLLIFRLLLLA